MRFKKKGSLQRTIVLLVALMFIAVILFNSSDKSNLTGNVVNSASSVTQNSQIQSNATCRNPITINSVYSDRGMIVVDYASTLSNPNIAVKLQIKNSGVSCTVTKNTCKLSSSSRFACIAQTSCAYPNKITKDYSITLSSVNCKTSISKKITQTNNPNRINPNAKYKDGENFGYSKLLGGQK